MNSISAIALVTPSAEWLPGYVAALESGWSPDNLRPAAAQEQLAAIRADAPRFLAALVDREARGAPITLPDGSKVPRLPGFTQWVVDGEFCGSINLRWQRGSNELPEHVLGHVGYGIVPWKRGRGYATLALAIMLRNARREGLDHVYVSTDVGNVASQRVIEANGGRDPERLRRGPQYGHTEALRYRLATPDIG